MKDAFQQWLSVPVKTWVVRGLSLILVYSYVVNQMIPGWVKANHRPNQEALEKAEVYWADAKSRLVLAEQERENSPNIAASKKNLERVQKQVKVYGYRVRDVYGPRAAKTRGGSDYASYHYAVHEAYLRGDPYAMEWDHHGLEWLEGETDLSRLRTPLKQAILDLHGSAAAFHSDLLNRFDSEEALASAAFGDIRDALVDSGFSQSDAGQLAMEIQLTPVLRQRMVDSLGSVRSLNSATVRDLVQIEGVDNGLALEIFKTKANQRGFKWSQAAMSRLAHEEGTRKSAVNPYFYPPPFLLGMSWVLQTDDLTHSFNTWFWVNQFALLGIVLVMIRWFQAPFVWIAIMLISFSPLPNNIQMGQANLPVLLIALLGLWKQRGWVIGVASMFKMSPALYLFLWAARKWWHRCLGAVLAAIALSLASLLLVDMDAQIRFYTEVLPSFSSGDYHGLSVPIEMYTHKGNHSIPEWFNQHWPGVDAHSLSNTAAWGSKVIVLSILGGLCWLGRQPRDPLGEGALMGAVTVLMLLTPVYTYEHHLVFLLFPLAVLGTALHARRIHWAWVLPSLLVYSVLAMPLQKMTKFRKEFSDFSIWIQEGKFISMLLLLALLTYVAVRSPICSQRHGSSQSGRGQENQTDPEKVGQ